MFLDSLKKENNINIITTENGATAYNSTLNAVYDLFALGGSYRTRSEEDCVFLFKKAFEENKELALKCLFYLRDILEGQGERRFFKVCFRWLSINFPKDAKQVMNFVPTFGRWDDLIYTTLGTSLEDDTLLIIKNQLFYDWKAEHPSLLAKWLPSENASNKKTRKIAYKIRVGLSLDKKEYRHILSHLREKIKVLEKIMSANRWEEVRFDKIPSIAGVRYSHAFKTREETKERYEDFMLNKNTSVNSKTLFPTTIVKRAMDTEVRRLKLEDAERINLEKCWESLPNYYQDREENAIAVVDVSGSMYGWQGGNRSNPIHSAIGLGIYIAERSKGPFANHFITFSSDPKVVKIEGVDIVDKIDRMEDTDWGFSTDIEAVFDLLLKTALKTEAKQEELPSKIYILSDMEFNQGLRISSIEKVESLLDSISAKWAFYGYNIPQLIFWNLEARQDNIPSLNKKFVCVSGNSPTIIKNILNGKDGYSMMLEKLNSNRYNILFEKS